MEQVESVCLLFLPVTQRTFLYGTKAWSFHFQCVLILVILTGSPEKGGQVLCVSPPPGQEKLVSFQLVSLIIHSLLHSFISTLI